MREVRIALVGTGKMARAHSQAYLTATRFFDLPVRPVLAVLCGRAAERTEPLASAFGWAEVADDWEQVVARDDLDLIDVCTPTGSHHEIVCAAAAPNRTLLCEKPMGVDAAQAQAMLAAVRRAGAAGAVVFNYRYAPAVRQARDLIAAGRLGEIRHSRFWFLQDWLTDPGRPMSWRLRRQEGGGVLLDLGSHLVDLIHHLVGPVSRVAAACRTFVSERADAAGASHPVDVEDTLEAVVATAPGAIGTLSASRLAAGHHCGSGFEITGSRGSVRWDFQRMNDLDLHLDEGPPELQGWRTVSVTRPGLHPWADAWWGGGHVLGYQETFVHQAVALLRRMGGEDAELPTFEEGASVQRVLDAIEGAGRSGRWVSV